MRVFDFENERLAEKIAEVKVKRGQLSLFRLFVFVGLICFLVLFFSDAFWWIFLLLASVAGFVYLIQQYNFQKDQGLIYRSLIQIEENKSARQNRNLSNLDQGAEFKDKGHPFCDDLDLFGSHSLFQLLNHTQSQTARAKLAEKLKSPMQLADSEKLREAVDELSQKSELLRAYEAVGMSFFDQSLSQNQWKSWLETEEKGKLWMLVSGVIGMLGGAVLFFLSYAEVIPFGFLGLWVLVGVFLMAFVFQPLKTAASKIPSKRTLKAFRHWLMLLEKEAFQAEYLQKSTESLKAQGILASEKLKGLDRMGFWIESRLNVLYIPINLILWTDLILYYNLFRWKRKFGEQVAHYPALLSDWEVWVSLGAFQQEVGRDGKVKLTEQLCFSGQELSHPLLSPKKAISNSFTIDRSAKLTLLTGANMSGKTTFMRTLGTNLVLINLGLRPFGESVELGQFQLYTSMRNSDNLGESVSSFYAELSRIKKLIDKLDSGEQLFFLLDEILKGTNTEDRISGSEALIRQLQDSPSLGIISTHDIELSQLENEIPYVKNYSFHSEIHDKTIDFDYKIKRGPCPSFNAHKLMELMGIRFQEREK